MIHRFIDEIAAGVVPFVLQWTDSDAGVGNFYEVWYVSQTPGQDLTVVPGALESDSGGIGDEICDPVASPDSQIVAWCLVAGASNSRCKTSRVDGTWQNVDAGSLMPSTLVVSMQPWWRPDGTGICYRTVDDSPAESIIRSVDIDPTDGTSSNDTALKTVAAASGTIWFPTYNFDGTKIVYALRRSGADDQIWAMDSDGSNAAQIATVTGFDIQNGAAFSVANTQDVIVYSKHSGANMEFRSVELDGTNDTLLYTDTTRFWGVTRRAWLNDDSEIFFFRRDLGSAPFFRIYTIDPGGGGASPLSPDRTSFGGTNDFLLQVFGGRIYWASGSSVDTTPVVSCLPDVSDLRTEFAVDPVPAELTGKDDVDWVSAFVGRSNGE